MTAVLPDSQTAAALRRPNLLVTVGSDFHPFNRLVGWVDGWLADGGALKVDCVMQYGTAQPPQHATGERFIGHDDLQRLMRDAAIIVMQGGPMGLLEARRYGAVPITIPRRRSLGEVVDDHQLAFCRHMMSLNETVSAESEQSLRKLLDRAVAVPEQFRSVVLDGRSRTQASIDRFAETADALLASSRRAQPDGPTRPQRRSSRWSRR